MADLGTQPVPGSNSKATASLALGIFSLSFVGFLSAVPAIVMGVIAKKEIDSSGGRLGGSWMAIAGIVLGMASTLVWWGVWYDFSS